MLLKTPISQKILFFTLFFLCPLGVSYRNFEVILEKRVIEKGHVKLNLRVFLYPAYSRGSEKT